MGSGEWIALVGLVVTIVTVVGSGVWVIARVTNSVERVACEIAYLHVEIKDLRQLIADVFERLDHQNTRLSRIEGYKSETSSYRSKADGDD